MINGAGEMENFNETCKTYKKVPNCLTFGFLPWGSISSDAARRLVCNHLIYSLNKLDYIALTLCLNEIEVPFRTQPELVENLQERF